MCPTVPAKVSFSHANGDCELSSMRYTPQFLSHSLHPSLDDGWPNKLVEKIAFVVSGIGPQTSPNVSSSTSTKNGSAPVNIGAAAVALMVMAGQTKVSPGPRPIANAAAISPE